MKRRHREARLSLDRRAPTISFLAAVKPGGLGDTPAGTDKIVEILRRCCLYNSRVLWVIVVFLLIIVILLWRR